MIEWTFEIDDVEYEEPQGWSDIALEINRDQEWHGVFFEASTSTLGWYGEAADYLRTKKETQGLAATAAIRITATCGEEVDVLEGTLDFGTYKERCGTTCIVQIAIERKGCTMTLRNRFEQKVDMDKATASDNQTVLSPYAGLNFEMEIPAQEIKVGDHAKTSVDIFQNLRDLPDFIPGLFSALNGYIILPFDTVLDSSLGVFQTSPIIDFVSTVSEADEETNGIPYPDEATSIGTANLLGSIRCLINDVEFSYRLKGHINIEVSDPDDGSYVAIRLWKLPAGSPEVPTLADWDMIYEEKIIGNPTPPLDVDGDHHVDFDKSTTMTVPVTQGDFFYFGVYFFNADQTEIDVADITFEDVSFFKFSGASVCETTTADVSLINETGSRIAESITDGCLRMKSDYFGRTDSQPYASAEDGCGSLRTLTSGLRLRNALNPTHFISMDEFFRGLKGIDNIGMGVEPDTEQGMDKEWLRVEPVEYFYQNIEIFRADSVPNAEWILDPTLGYSSIRIGYQRWEVENVNGLDEFNSNKEFRTSLKTINNILDAQSPFVAGGYPIEITRQQSFADSGGADTTYDNDNFIICVERDTYGFHVEQGNIVDAADFYSPETAYNWRIRPLYNLMRWWKSVAQTYRNLGSSLSKLFFAGGTGNLLARGSMLDDCELASAALPENWDLAINNFKVSSYPIHKPDRVVFEYPFSLRNYLDVKANPYGYISVQCGAGTFVKGYIISIQYSPVNGTALFNLKLRWDI